MTLSFDLYGLREPRLHVDLIRSGLTTLQNITTENLKRFTQGNTTFAFRNRKEELVRRIKACQLNSVEFRNATDVIGKEKLLLSIYLECLDQTGVSEWLPNFDKVVATYVLGNDGRNWHIGRRWQVFLLLFTHFDRLSALSFVCDRIREAFTTEDISSQLVQIRVWYEYRDILFQPDGPRTLVEKKEPSEDIKGLMTRFSIPEQGRYAEILCQELLLNQLKKAPFGKEFDFFIEIESQKNKRAYRNILLGSAALKIMVERVLLEGNRRWPDKWCNWITRFGCDPRYGRGSPIVSKWWGWATDDEYRLAVHGVTGLTIQFFIEFLKNSLNGTNKASQFSLRSRFLLALYYSGKIEQARMIINQNEIYSLDSKYRNSLFVAKLKGTTSHTSMICLKCVNDIFIIEGTHSFGLRVFHGTFPIIDFWNSQQESYQDRNLRISPSDCPVFLRHDKPGNWVGNFFFELRYKFHVEWKDIKI